MPTKLCRWGNSLGLRIPAFIVDCAHWKAGDLLEVRLLENDNVLVRPVKPRNGGGSVIEESSQPEQFPAKKEVW